MAKAPVFRTPQSVIYGRGAFQALGEEVAQRGKRALLISDPVMKRLGYVEEALAQLKKVNVTGTVYTGVASEPTDVYVAEALERFRAEKCDVIVSLGGGSCIDTAKAVAVVATSGGRISDYFGGGKPAVQAPVPHLALPTTAGTGSEATDATIITNTANEVKMMIKQPAFMPTVAIVDPLLSLSSPPKVTAATGIDALSHSIEAYISRKAHPMTDMIARSAMRLIVDHLQTAFENGDNLDAREAMALGALQGGMAFSNASVCLVHGMSRPIGALFHVPHGVSNAMLLPAVLEFSAGHARERLADLGCFFADGEVLPEAESAHLAVTSIKKLCLDLDIPNLKGWGIDPDKFESAITKMASDALASGSPANNPRIPSHEEIETLYRICYDYDFQA
ncbi:iron-containing alcohol dehydrogenase [Sporolactobacillus vineae]|uniref:iron-containing alcohol dehydrogenase n=1 Tax=Sporolactobacillus vineae TaxID=444463 RepID=UPI0002894AC8|nr:iron-containing alcohol dehydrogenase [Sporolactobacillus vineae]